MPAAAQQPVPLDLADFQWQNRLVLLFAPEAADPTLRAQQQALRSEAAALAERDLLTIQVVGREVLLQRSAEPEVHGAATAARLRRAFDVDTDAFTLLLIGKDGTVKRRAATALPMDSLYVQIDAMPMRQQEMRENERDGE
ncbi:MAG: DUF4174 domain-containing protein [Bacteroidota bacterium]